MKLTKAERADIDAAADAVREKQKALEDALAEYNSARESLRGKLEDLHANKHGEFEDKSERWQNGEKGQEAEAWLQQIDDGMNALQDEVEIEFIDVDTIVEFPNQPE